MMKDGKIYQGQRSGRHGRAGWRGRRCSTSSGWASWASSARSSGSEGDTATLQIYEDTTGVRPGDKVVNTGQALSVELGPGLLTSIYDGIQRPLNILREQSGDFISRGLVIPALDEKKKWDFVPAEEEGRQGRRRAR